MGSRTEHKTGTGAKGQSGPIAALSLLKLAAICAIMWIHTVSFRPDNAFPFNSCQTLVELFLMITGFFTFRHFQKERYISLSLDDKCRSAWRYTADKFLRFVPYMLLALLAVNLPRLSDASSLEGALNVLRDMVLGAFYLTGIPGAYPLTPVWYLSALFIAFPLFCVLCQLKNTRIIALGALAGAICYYFGTEGCAYKTAGIVPRAFIGLCAGIAVHYAADWLRTKKLTSLSKTLLTLTLALCLGTLFAFYQSPVAGFARAGSSKGFCVLLIAIVLVIILSEQTVVSSLRHRFFSHVEQLSMTMFILHYVVVFHINRSYSHLPLDEKLAAFCVGTVVLSLAAQALFGLLSPLTAALKSCFVKE